jgi:uncharacterized protein
LTYYLDTCIIISAFYQDMNSQSVLAWLEKVENTSLCSSDWVYTEAPSSLGRNVRDDRLAPVDADRIWQRMSRWLHTDCTLEPVQTDDFKRAAELQTSWQLGLRTGDALHAAICERLKLPLVTHDKKFAAAARKLNVPVIEP